jgi:hypothetical protein
LTSKIKPPQNLKSLLGLGLKFIPTPPRTTSWNALNHVDPLQPHGFERFGRDLRLRCYFAGSNNDDPDFNRRMYPRSKWIPSSYPSDVAKREKNFQLSLKKIFKTRKGKTNLLPHQHQALQYLRDQPDFLIVQCDKNLGPAIIEKEKYIELAFRDHFNDTETYRHLSPSEATEAAEQIRQKLNAWIKMYAQDLTKNEKKFLQQKADETVDPFPVFYLTFKVHKTPLKTRPIVSCSGSLLFGLGIWVDDKLQKLARLQRSYFKSSFDLKKTLDSLQLPPNAQLFSADAVSMYTNIPTTHALAKIKQYLTKNVFAGVPAEALSAALEIVMTNNVFTFGDTTWHQKSGTAMGTPPAPPYATLYYAIYEELFLDDFPDNLVFYKRFIDDCIGIWTPSADPNTDSAIWNGFQDLMNCAPGLTWEFTPRGPSLDFMDLTITIQDNRIYTTLFEKALNLYLYIPPHSAHPPGILSGLILGMIYRINKLCTDPTDARKKVSTFYHRILARGYNPTAILPLFQKAFTKLQDTTTTPAAKNNPNETILFHLRYHPQDPPSQSLQLAWTENLLRPPNLRPLPHVTNNRHFEIGVKRLIVCYRRSLNLGNLLSYRRLVSSPLASSFLTRQHAGQQPEPQNAHPHPQDSRTEGILPSTTSRPARTTDVIRNPYSRHNTSNNTRCRFHSSNPS